MLNSAGKFDFEMAELTDVPACSRLEFSIYSMLGSRLGAEMTTYFTSGTLTRILHLRYFYSGTLSQVRQLRYFT